MARKLNPQGLIYQKDWLFAQQAHRVNDLENQIIQTMNKHNLPVKVVVEDYKSGGFLSGTSDKLLTIDGGFQAFCGISYIPFGDYLCISMYLFVEDTVANKIAGKVTGQGITGLASMGMDMLTVRKLSAFENCVLAALDETFNALDLTEFKPGFRGI